MNCKQLILLQFSNPRNYPYSAIILWYVNKYFIIFTKMKLFSKAIKLLLLTFVLVLSFSQSILGQVDSLMQVLETEMIKKQVYDDQKMQRIEAYKQMAAKSSTNPKQAFLYYSNLIEEFEKFSFDSTLFYIDKNIKIANSLKNDSLMNESKLYLSATLANVGRSKEAEDVLKQIDSKNLSKELFIKYCNTARRLYEDLSFYAITQDGAEKYTELYNLYKDTLLNVVDSNSYIYLSILEKDLLDDRELEESLKVNSQILKNIEPNSKQFSVVTFYRSLIYDLMGDEEKEKEYLMISAISDIRASIKDNASLTTLAKVLYSEGKIRKAHKYIQNAYDDAIFYNSRLRFLEISKILSLITASYQEISENQKSTLKDYLVLISSLSFVLLITIALIVRQVKKLSATRNGLKDSNQQLNHANQDLKQAKSKLEKLYTDLSEANHVKEQYIASFLSIHSDYIDKIDKYQNVVRRLLTSRKYDELYKRVTSQEVIDAEVKEFYATFDQAFLSIYPDFISKFNELLLDEEKIELKENEILNTELRIFALIRLGIKDSSNIARLLRYSVNTIYNYRVKIKNKAKVDREEFEKLIQEIDAFENTSS